MKKFDIIKTFEIFNAETISILKDAIVKFVLVETDNFFKGNSSVSAEIKNQKEISFSIINKPKMYNLLTSTWNKQQKRLKKYENSKS